MNDDPVPARTAARPGDRLRRVLLLLVLVAAIAAFFLLGGDRLLTLESVRTNRDALQAFATNHRVAAVALAFVAYAAIVALSLPAAAVMSLACGFVFGRWLGTAVVVAAATTGATLAFLAARYLFADAVRHRLGPTIARIDEGLRKSPFGWLLFLRLVPLFPFFAVNLALALTAVPTRRFALATLVGILPGSFVYVNLGEALGSIDSTSGLLSGRTLAAFVLLGLLALVPTLVRRRRAGR